MALFKRIELSVPESDLYAGDGLPEAFPPTAASRSWATGLDSEEALTFVGDDGSGAIPLFMSAREVREKSLWAPDAGRDSERDAGRFVSGRCERL
ncbi:MAG: hypothetical protein AB7U63_18460 [Porticoccaceae bacterium]